MLREFQGQSPKVHEESYVDPSAQLIGDVRIAHNASVWPNVTLRADDGNHIAVGEGSNVQDNSVCHVTPENPVIIGSNVTIGHSVVLHGCTIEDDALIGIGAIILDGAVVEKGAQVAAGALVGPGKVVATGTLAMGVPAKSIRELSAEESADIVQNARDYETLWRKYV